MHVPRDPRILGHLGFADEHCWTAQQRRSTIALTICVPGVFTGSLGSCASKQWTWRFTDSAGSRALSWLEWALHMFGRQRTDVATGLIPFGCPSSYLAATREMPCFLSRNPERETHPCAVAVLPSGACCDDSVGAACIVWRDAQAAVALLRDRKSEAAVSVLFPFHGTRPTTRRTPQKHGYAAKCQRVCQCGSSTRSKGLTSTRKKGLVAHYISPTAGRRHTLAHQKRAATKAQNVRAGAGNRYRR
jgi:hypothetical protein